MDSEASSATNRQIEDRAIAYVMDRERTEGRQPEDTRGRSAPADLSSSGRIIEVKAYGKSARGADLWLETRQVATAARAPEQFWLYIVENVRQGDPALFRLMCIGGADLQALLARAVERRYFSVPFPVAVYDRLAAPG